MNQFQSAVATVEQSAFNDASTKRATSSKSDDATAKMANAISQKTFGRKLWESEKAWLMSPFLLPGPGMAPLTERWFV
jgi:uncharacterized protein YaaW (UPF0174 family)